MADLVGLAVCQMDSQRYERLAMKLSEKALGR